MYIVHYHDICVLPVYKYMYVGQFVMIFDLNFRIVFANRKRALRKDEIVSKRFILSENAYFFGPLHCGKTRERYKEGRYPENMETVTVSNICMMETSVSFYFQRDHNATTFLLDPPDMTLQPGESKVLLYMYRFLWYTVEFLYSKRLKCPY